MCYVHILVFAWDLDTMILESTDVTSTEVRSKIIYGSLIFYQVITKSVHVIFLFVYKVSIKKCIPLFNNFVVVKFFLTYRGIRENSTSSTPLQ